MREKSESKLLANSIQRRVKLTTSWRNYLFTFTREHSIHFTIIARWTWLFFFRKLITFFKNKEAKSLNKRSRKTRPHQRTDTCSPRRWEKTIFWCFIVKYPVSTSASQIFLLSFVFFYSSRHHYHLFLYCLWVSLSFACLWSRLLGCVLCVVAKPEKSIKFKSICLKLEVSLRLQEIVCLVGFYWTKKRRERERAEEF